MLQKLKTNKIAVLYLKMGPHEANHRTDTLIISKNSIQLLPYVYSFYMQDYCPHFMIKHDTSHH